MSRATTEQGEGRDEVRAARVLVVASERAQRVAILKQLPRVGAGPYWVAEDRPSAVEAARLHQPEVAIIELGLRDCEGPAAALQMRMLVRHVEVVFFSAPDQAGEIAAARDLGLDRVLPFDELFEKLEQVLLPLAECARLRRRLDEVEERTRQFNQEAREALDAGRMALPEAERRYRETYIRSLLAETGNRREAARLAGVPYTTLCEIIRKLGIPGG